MSTSSGVGDQLLAALAQSLTAGLVRIVDLTKPLGPDTPVIKLPAHIPSHPPVKLEIGAGFDAPNAVSYWQKITFSEHSGTHFDAPIHWRSGKDHPNNSTDTIPVANFVAPACGSDISAKAAADPNYLATAADVAEWESRHGTIPPRHWVLLRTDWSRKPTPEAYLNMLDGFSHTPGPGADFIDAILARDCVGFGVETVGIDAGQGLKMTPPMPAHTLVLKANRYGMSGLVNLDLLPPKGALLISAPLKIVKGSGSPLRALAIVA